MIVAFFWHNKLLRSFGKAKKMIAFCWRSMQTFHAFGIASKVFLFFVQRKQFFFFSFIR